MGKFNLLDEPWISVIVDDKGTSQEVSLKALFENAHLYKELAGDTKTQDFAVMRVLLAVLHTVFSRVDAAGKVYEVEGRKLFELNERLKPEREMDPAHLDDYENLLFDTWEDIWGQQKFPCTINDYLEKWRDRFNLLDEEYPFFQVTESILKSGSNITDSSGKVSGRTFNRLISQSGNKVALFAPKFSGVIGDDATESNEKELGNRDRLSYSQLTRWLITYQGYSGAEGKVKFKFRKNASPSKGWIYDIGGIYIKGKNIFDTLMLNFYLPYGECENLQHIQTPCWECSDDEVVNQYLTRTSHNNIASLYTDWSRGVYINPEFEENEPFFCKCAKLPAIEYLDNFLEPMTLWDKKNKTENRLPCKHKFEEAMWRSFGLMTHRMSTKESNERLPGIMNWLSELKSQGVMGNRMITLEAVSMQAGKPASSSVPVNEIIDQLTLASYVLMDDSDNGWIVRINDTIEFTQDVVDKIYRSYLNDIKRVRNLENADGFLKRNIATMYYCLDAPFREWLASIQPEDDFDETILKWRSVLKDLILEQAKEHLHHAPIRDYTGIKMDNRVENIVTVYHKFLNSLNKKFS